LIRPPGGSWEFTGTVFKTCFKRDSRKTVSNVDFEN
jgi:hypothetical protein